MRAMEFVAILVLIASTVSADSSEMNEVLKDVVEPLAARFLKAYDALNDLKNGASQEYVGQTTYWPLCCDKDRMNLVYEEAYGLPADVYACCRRGPCTANADFTAETASAPEWNSKQTTIDGLTISSKDDVDKKFVDTMPGFSGYSWGDESNRLMVGRIKNFG